MVGAPADGPVICYNDLSAYNAIRTARDLVLPDWDLAAPGTLVWDVACAVYRWVPLYDDATCARLDIPVPTGATDTLPSGIGDAGGHFHWGDS